MEARLELMEESGIETREGIQKANQYERELWLLRGLIEYGLDRGKLEAIKGRYERIDEVPTHYDFADFFFQ